MLQIVDEKCKYFEKNWKFLSADRELCRGICNSEASVISLDQPNPVGRVQQMKSLGTSKNLLP